MIIGDPNLFAVFIDVVEEWNIDRSFNNGMLGISIDGTLFPKKVVGATLNTELFELIKNLEDLKEDMTFFQMDRNEMFTNIYKVTFPDDLDVDNDYSYNVTPFVLWDNNIYVFMVSNGSEIRIVAAELQYIVEESTHNLQDLQVAETYVSHDKIQEIVYKLKTYQKNILVG